MTTLYIRQVRVEIQGDQDIFKIPDGLKIELDIKKNSTDLSAVGEVIIYNLTQSTRSILREKGKTLKIYAGYRDDVGLLHAGEIFYTTARYEGLDRAFVITLGAKTITANSAIFNKTYTGSTLLRSIVKDAIDTLETPYAVDILDVLPEVTLKNYTFSGKSLVAIKDLLKPYNLQLFDRNNQLFITKIGQPLAGQEEDIYVLNASTGLIKAPDITDSGINATSLLNPRLQAGQIIKLESDVLKEIDKRSPAGKQFLNTSSGFYKIIQVQFRGDNWDGTYQSLLQCVPFTPSSTTNSS